MTTASTESMSKSSDHESSSSTQCFRKLLEHYVMSNVWWVLVFLDYSRSAFSALQVIRAVRVLSMTPKLGPFCTP